MVGQQEQDLVWWFLVARRTVSVCVHRKREHPGANFKYLSFSFFLSLPQLLRLFSKTERLELAYYSTGRKKAKWMRESESRGKASHRHQLSLSLPHSFWLSFSLFAVQTPPPLSLFPSVAVPSLVGRGEWDWEKVSQSVSRQFWTALLSSCLSLSIAHLLAPPKQQSRPVLLELVPMCVFLFAPSVINANLIFDWVLIEFSDFQLLCVLGRQKIYLVATSNFSSKKAIFTVDVSVVISRIIVILCFPLRFTTVPDSDLPNLLFLLFFFLDQWHWQ